MSSDVAIKVENLSKCYHLYETPRARLKQFLLPRIQRNLRLVPRQYFKEFWALRDVSFEVRKGETIGIIGRNGGGKSTLLQLICGTLSPTTGSVQVKGRIAALLELGSGFNPEFTGRENVYMNAAILGVGKDEIDTRFHEITSFADIGHFIEQPVKSYSSGMVVRLAFAVQAMVDPDILVVDEALAVGDEKFQRKCFSRLEELKAKGTSVLFVSHSAANIIELCDKTILLDQGRQLMQATPERAVRAYQKMIYAPPEEYAKLVSAYLSGERDDAKTLDEDTDAPVASPECIDASYDAGLLPETTTSYPTQGAEIQSIGIKDSSDRLVNVLRPGEIYQFEVKGRLLANFSGIFFGLHIRNISGVVITGQRWPQEATYVRNAKGGDEFTVSFSFRMDILPGVYFVGAGIWSAEEPTCPHRIVDALMFRVEPTERAMSFGYVDLMSVQPSLKLGKIERV